MSNLRPLSIVPVVLALLAACSASNDVTKEPGPGLAADDAGASDGAASNDESSVPEEQDSGSGFGGSDAQLDSLDPNADNDGDGYAFKDDCNDKDPEVNPGAFDVAGDGVDNDCDGTIDNPDEGCDLASLKLDSKEVVHYARALGLCKVADLSAEGKDKRWGLVNVQLLRADGKGAPDPLQYGIQKSFGPNVKPREGANLVALSTGTARTPGQPGFVVPLSPSYEGSSSVTPPAGFPKNAADCPTPSSTEANDSVNLKLTIRVPTNARAFSFDFDFYSSEYITFVCSSFNDTFIARLSTGAKLDPKNDGNIVFDAMKNPISVNSGFFEVCTPGTKGSRNFPCAKGTKELEGTGYWDPTDPTENGATSWLRTTAPVVPGEIMTLELMIWDTGDHAFDSTVLLDNFRWDAKGSTAPTTDRPPS